MTDNEINEAIAKACGWQQRAHGGWAKTSDLFNISKEPPSYTTDLNAMHEVEKTLGPDGRGSYLLKLEAVATSGRAGLSFNDIDYLMAHATARQRAEAFLRVKGLWKEAAV